MQTRHRFVLKHRILGGYIPKLANGYTKNLFEAITFSTYENAEFWLYNAYAAPSNPEDYEITETTEQRFEKEETA